jgi:hypothetical protein
MILGLIGKRMNWRLTVLWDLWTKNQRYYDDMCRKGLQIGMFAIVMSYGDDRDGDRFHQGFDAEKQRN